MHITRKEYITQFLGMNSALPYPSTHQTSSQIFEQRSHGTKVQQMTHFVCRGKA